MRGRSADGYTLATTSSCGRTSRRETWWRRTILTTWTCAAALVSHHLSLIPPCSLVRVESHDLASSGLGPCDALPKVTCMSQCTVCSAILCC